jgi:hypothetical protein
MTLDGYLGDDPIARREGLDLLAHFHNFTAPLVAGDEGKGTLLIGAFPHVHVRATDASRLDVDEHLVVRRLGVWEFF